MYKDKDKESLKRPYIPAYSRGAAYTVASAAVVGAGLMAVKSLDAFLAGTGSVAASAGSFTTPFLRLVHKANDFYSDAHHYIRTGMFRPLLGKGYDGTAYQPVYSRKVVYGLMAAAGTVTGVLLLTAPEVVLAATGSIAVNAASYTTPVMKVVHRANELITDTLAYFNSDFRRLKGDRHSLRPPPLHNDTLEIIPHEPRGGRHHKALAYGVIGAAALGTVALAVAAPSILMTLAGKIAGSAISYTKPFVRLVRNLNRLYEDTGSHLKEDLFIPLKEGLIADKKERSWLRKTLEQIEPESRAKTNLLPIPKPVIYASMIAVTAGVTLSALYVPTFLVAALGAVAGSAAAFTKPVINAVRKFNHLYDDAEAYVRHDFRRKFPSPGDGPLGSVPPPPSPSGPTSRLDGLEIKTEFMRITTPSRQQDAPLPQAQPPEQDAPVQAERRNAIPPPPLPGGGNDPKLK
jgi:hypothetical protein